MNKLNKVKMKKVIYSTKVITLMLCCMAFCFFNSGCSKDDNDNEATNYETALIGSWVEDVADLNGIEVFHMIINSNHTGSSYVTRYGEKSDNSTFTWSATATTITITDDEGAHTTPYKIINGKVHIYGESEIVYRKVSNDNDATNYETALIGAWVEDVSDLNGIEVFHLIFNSNHTGSKYVTNNGVVIDTRTGTWSANATTITITDGEGTYTGSYKIINGKLHIYGEEEIVYRKV